MTGRKTNDRVRGTFPEVEVAARKLRQNMTPAESCLWAKLRSKQMLGLRFRRQHPVGRLILDFYCPALKLAIEVDGDIHLQQMDYDRYRTENLEAYGYRVLRFSNDEVMHDISAALEIIQQTIQELQNSE